MTSICTLTHKVMVQFKKHEKEIRSRKRKMKTLIVLQTERGSSAWLTGGRKNDSYTYAENRVLMKSVMANQWGSSTNNLTASHIIITVRDLFNRSRLSSSLKLAEQLCLVSSLQVGRRKHAGGCWNLRQCSDWYQQVIRSQFRYFTSWWRHRASVI